MPVVLKWEHFNLLALFWLFNKFFFNCVQIELKPIPSLAENLSFLIKHFFQCDGWKSSNRYIYILNNNRNPQYCNGGDLADYLNGNFLSAQSSYHICQTQTWCRNLCKSLKNLMIFFPAKGTLSEDTIRRFLRQLGRLWLFFQKIKRFFSFQQQTKTVQDTVTFGLRAP